MPHILRKVTESEITELGDVTPYSTPTVVEDIMAGKK